MVVKGIMYYPPFLRQRRLSGARKELDRTRRMGKS